LVNALLMRASRSYLFRHFSQSRSEAILSGGRDPIFWAKRPEISVRVREIAGQKQTSHS